MKKVWSLVMAVCLVFGCFACQNQQEEVYSSALEEAKGGKFRGGGGFLSAPGGRGG